MEKLTELLKDKAFAEEFFKQETAEDAQKFLASKGVDVTIDELNQLRDAIVTRLDDSNGDELSDDQLENVAGGMAVATVAGIVAGVAGATSFGVALFDKIKSWKW